tara:strand:+ start:1742 stop:2344 length:603 start_codon:yes stop_codon:yes gene_type:complete
MLLMFQERVARDDQLSSKSITVKQLFHNLQKFAVPYQKGVNSTATQIVFDEMLKDLTKEFDGTFIEFRTRITKVTWDDGIAKLYRDSELPPIPRNKSDHPISVTFSSPISVKMTQEAAASLRPGTWMEFEAELEFKPKEYIFITPKSQVMYRLQSKVFSSNILGTFVTNNYRCKVDRQKVQGVWQKADVNDSENMPESNQ